MDTFRSSDCSTPPDEIAATGRILVIGPPRSGTTWVEQVLGRAAGARVVHEPDNETCSPFALRAKTSLGRFPVLGPSDAAPPAYFDLWSRAFEGVGRAATARWLTAKALLRTADGDLDAAFDQRQHRFSTRLRMISALASLPPAPLAERPGEQPVLVKSVHASLAAEWVAARWRPKVVVVLRQPLNIIASHVALGWGPSDLDSHALLLGAMGEGARMPAIRPDATPLQRLAWQIGVFVSALERAVQRYPGWLVVSHDELCRDPAAGFSSLCAALGVPWTADAADLLAASDRPGKGLETRRVAAEQPGNWSRELTVAQVDEALEVLSAFPDRLFGAASVP
ncbi:MAG TPA: sulfotransferase [Acidimicrobiia bacterium]|nr:sulfotransferase [Acidimicrobiia bacterium]